MFKEPIALSRERCPIRQHSRNQNNREFRDKPGTRSGFKGCLHKVLTISKACSSESQLVFLEFFSGHGLPMATLHCVDSAVCRGRRRGGHSFSSEATTEDSRRTRLYSVHGGGGLAVTLPGLHSPVGVTVDSWPVQSRPCPSRPSFHSSCMDWALVGTWYGPGKAVGARTC